MCICSVKLRNDNEPGFNGFASFLSAKKTKILFCSALLITACWTRLKINENKFNFFCFSSRFNDHAFLSMPSTLSLCIYKRKIQCGNCREKKIVYTLNAARNKIMYKCKLVKNDWRRLGWEKIATHSTFAEKKIYIR